MNDFSRTNITLGIAVLALVALTTACPDHASAQTKKYTNADLKSAPRSAEEERVLAEREKQHAEQQRLFAEAQVRDEARKKGYVAPTLDEVKAKLAAEEAARIAKMSPAERATDAAQKLGLIAIARCDRIYAGSPEAQVNCYARQTDAIIAIVKRTKTVNLFDREACRRFAGDDFVIMNACEERRSK